MDVDKPNAPPTVMTGEKRKVITVSADTREEVPDPKRPNIELDIEKKKKVLLLLINSFRAFTRRLESTDIDKKYLSSELFLSSQISSIIFTLHNYHRQAFTVASSNLRTKAVSNAFKVQFMGKEYSLTFEEADKIYMREVEIQGLVYRKYDLKDGANWYGTMGPYLELTGAFALRMKEVRLGHGKMPIGRNNAGDVVQCNVSEYGLSGAHHILLSGSTFPPERRTSMAQSLGPMTILLSMIRTQATYRDKWKNAAKRAFAHIPNIDAILDILISNSKASDVSQIVSLLAEIALITTTREASRICMPLCMLSFVYNLQVTEAQKESFFKNFNTAGRGGFVAYHQATEQAWYVQGNASPEMIAQMIHLGRNDWLPEQIYNSVDVRSKTNSAFVRGLACAVFGTTTLETSSVTGQQCNRTKGNTLPALDATKLIAIHDIVQYRIMINGDSLEQACTFCRGPRKIKKKAIGVIENENMAPAEDENELNLENEIALSHKILNES
ncbi:hypothetical protein RN001_005599 [Aquatica leii]|uniref:BEN domain-containing protein n=1 Tax=Aquatica leii TaxID=1421715 RepID=A0AAN7P6S3_9COLE|nr:hypothetical protein RN001_005599 [Aquatica leii]